MINWIQMLICSFYTQEKTAPVSYHNIKSFTNSYVSYIFFLNGV